MQRLVASAAGASQGPGYGHSHAQGHLPLVPLRVRGGRLRCHGTGVWSVPLEIGSGVAWIVVPKASETNVLE